MANSNSHWAKWITILVLIALVGGGGFWYYRRKAESAPKFITAPVTRGDLQQVVTATGQLSPVVNVQVGSQISGRIKAIHADFNSKVSSNQVIAEIDPSTYQVNVFRAEAQLSNSVANLALANVQAQRAESLFKDNLIPAADHDTAIAQLQQAQAQVQSDKANLESANVDLSRCTIVAPVDGVVISRNVDVGQTVAASFNTPTLFVIANDLTKMQIGALVSEADIGGVQVGQDATFTVDAFPYRTFHGKVSQVRYGAVTNQNVVNYSAMINVDNSDLKLLPSMTANVSIIVQNRKDVLMIKNAALRFRPPEGSLPVETTNNVARTGGPNAGRGAGRFGGAQGGGRGGPGGPGAVGGRTRADRGSFRTVYVLDASKDAEHPELKPVKIKIGITDGVNTEVTEGLKEGDQVVTDLAIEDTAVASQPNNPFGGRRRRF